MIQTGVLLRAASPPTCLTAITLGGGSSCVKSGVWPLKEYINGEVIHTKVPKQRVPVEEYLKLQGRFVHLFEPQRSDALLTEIQTKVDRYWEGVIQAE